MLHPKEYLLGNCKTIFDSDILVAGVLLGIANSNSMNYAHKTLVKKKRQEFIILAGLFDCFEKNWKIEGPTKLRIFNPRNKFDG